MFNDLINSIKAQIHEKATSPLAAVFGLAWLVWNFRYLITVFSDLSPQEAFQYIDQVLYPTPFDHILYKLVYPLGTTLAVLFLYPAPARWIYRYWREQHRKLKDVRLRADGFEPLHEDKAMEINLKIRELRLEQKKETDGLIRENEELRELLRSHESTSNSEIEMAERIAKLRTSLEESREERDRLNSRVGELLEELETKTKSHSPQKLTNVSLISDYILGKLGLEGDKSLHELERSVPASSARLNAALDSLGANQLIFFADHSISLTDAGRDKVIEFDLDQVYEDASKEFGTFIREDEEIPF